MQVQYYNRFIGLLIAIYRRETRPFCTLRPTAGRIIRLTGPHGRYVYQFCDKNNVTVPFNGEKGTALLKRLHVNDWWTLYNVYVSVQYIEPLDPGVQEPPQSTVLEPGHRWPVTFSTQVKCETAATVWLHCWISALYSISRVLWWKMVNSRLALLHS